MEVDIRHGPDDTLVATTRIPDWFGYPPSDPVPIVFLESGELRIEDLQYGAAILEFDPDYRQLVGEIDHVRREGRVHLKRALPPPASGIRVEPVSIPSGDVLLSGELHIPPAAENPHPAIILVGGRGCSPRDRALARELPAYGMAVLTYDKRGTGESGGDCDSFTLDDLVGDVLSALEFARSDSRIAPQRIGLWGGSAGAWTIQAATEHTLSDPETRPPAFLVTWIGPATSIAQQQADSGRAIGADLGLSETELASVQEALALSLDDTLDPDRVHARLNAIADAADAAGWRSSMFDTSDIPASPADVERLWIRRFRYDPTELLRNLSDIPYLAVLGEDDPIVPFEINRDALLSAASISGNPNMEVVGIPAMGHGFEHGDREAALPSGEVYFKMDTVEPLYFTATVEFLREMGFLPK